MGETPNIRTVKQFALRVKKDFSDAQVFLFGSRAGNDFLLDSDFDVLVVSSKFEKIPFFRRTEKMYDYWKKPLLLEAFCYTPAEFLEKRRRIGFVAEALKKSVKITV